ncbi:SDR family NAD(P)-dependent oxidoreductase [Pseudomonas fulva]|nr:SDR family NAD(P)-dependent oxidoreductase [Pseudomonas fulva]
MSTPVVHAALNFTLTGRTALVTGAARGIGHAIAMALGQAGARVGVCDLDAEAAEAAAARLREVGIEAVGVGADVADEAQVQAMVGQVQAMLGGVDILVNNAGIVSTGPLLEVTTAEWNRVMAIDLNSVFFCAKAVLPGMMARQSGRIINIASVAGKRGGLAGQ